MNFIEAVQALKTRKCKRIKRSRWYNGISGESVEALFTVSIEEILADDWELGDPIAEIKNIEIERWMCAECDNVCDFDPKKTICGASLNAKGDFCKSTSYIKLTGLIRVSVSKT